MRMQRVATPDSGTPVLRIGSRSFQVSTLEEGRIATEYLMEHVFRVPKTRPSNLRLCLLFGSVAFCFIAAGAALGYYSKDWSWFARSGSLCLLVGATMI